jgi:hypothetical protein
MGRSRIELGIPAFHGEEDGDIGSPSYDQKRSAFAPPIHDHYSSEPVDLRKPINTDQ